MTETATAPWAQRQFANAARILAAVLALDEADQLDALAVALDAWIKKRDGGLVS
jgi:hypothetical protein